jgi:translation initiation factor IF-2
MERQLIKVAKELNVGMGTIVEYLHEKGFDVDNKPIAKISDGMYDALAKKFSDSRAEKEKADQIVIGTRPIEKRIVPPPVVITPTIPVVASERKTVNLFASKEVAPPKEVTILVTPKEVVVTPPPPTPKVEEQQQQQPEVRTPVLPDVIERPKVVMPKVLGKIDLDARANTPQQQQRPQQDNRQGSNNNNNNNNNNNRQDNRQGSNNNNNNNRQDNRQGSNNNNRPDNRNNTQYTNRTDDRNRQGFKPRPPEPLKPFVEPVKLEPFDLDGTNAQTTMESSDELIRAEAPQLRGLKIKGKIDIEKFIEKDPRNNTGNKKKKRGGRNDKPVAGAGTAVPGAPRTDAESEAARKRKRRRKKVPSATDGQNQQNNTGQGNNRPGGNTGQGNNRPGGNTGQGNNRPGGNTGQGNNRPGGNTSNYRPGDNRNTGTGTNNVNRGPVEISQQEIEAKIKETMARLNMGGKNKGQKIRRDKRVRFREKAEQLEQAQADAKLQVTEFISLSDLAGLLDVSPTQIITTCMSMGIFASINQRLDAELIEVIASEFNREVEFISAEEQLGAVLIDDPDNEEDLLPRAPVVTMVKHPYWTIFGVQKWLRAKRVVSHSTSVLMKLNYLTGAKLRS